MIMVTKTMQVLFMRKRMDSADTRPACFDTELKNNDGSLEAMID